jgi:type 1 glutamine amidotransferase
MIEPVIRRWPVSLGCVVVGGLAMLAQARAPRISDTYPPPVDVRDPDLTLRVADRGAVPVVAYTGNGRYLATAGVDRVITLWDVRPGEDGTGAHLRTLVGHTGRVLAIAPGTAPNTLVSVSTDQTVRTWDETTGAQIGQTSIPIGTGFQRSRLVAGPPPRLAVSDGRDVTLWDYESGTFLRRLDPPIVGVMDFAFTPDGRRLFVATANGFYDVNPDTGLSSPLDAGAPVGSVAASSKAIVAGLADGRVQLWSPTIPTPIGVDSQATPSTPRGTPPLRTWRAHTGAVQVLAFDPRGEQLASAGADGTIKVWDVASGALLCSQEGHNGPAMAIAFSSNGQKMASGGSDGTARTWTVPLPPISREVLPLITAGIPAKARVAPKKPRRLLVFWRADAILHKSGVPAVNHAIAAMAARTGAFTAEFSRDAAVFDPAVLARYDAIVMNSTAHIVLTDAQKHAYVEFARNGGGIVGIHAAIDMFRDWPEGAAVIGATFGDHPWGPNGTWAVSLEEPSHPLLQAWGGRDFTIRDELYVMGAPYTRADRRVLLRANLADAATAAVDLSRRPDRDFALSWIKRYGKGRVFYADFGHIAEPLTRSDVLQYYLDGIQYALGDLDVDDAPVSTPSR